MYNNPDNWMCAVTFENAGTSCNPVISQIWPTDTFNFSNGTRSQHI